MMMLEEKIRREALRLGFECCGFASLHEVQNYDTRYMAWIGRGEHGCMQYADRYHDVRRDPRLLLEGAQSIIALAHNYYPESQLADNVPQFAYYAYGEDYHDVLRDKARELVRNIASEMGGVDIASTFRICVDTAPLRERYWAHQAGLGFVGRNAQLIIPECGSYFFLCFIVTTLALKPDEPCSQSCLGCDLCLKSCPTGALQEGGVVDANKCLSCLTIEYHGEFPPNLDLYNHIYGCDECAKCCPHNVGAKPCREARFAPSEEFLSLDFDSLQRMDEENFRRIFRRSAVKRTKYAGLMRNLRQILKKR